MSWKHMPNAPTTGTILCRLEDIPDGEAKGFTFGSGKDSFNMLVVRQYTALYGYLNECPHAFTPLDFQPDEFMDMGKQFLHCATHGALFQIEDGLCVAGPCQDQSLTAIAVKLEDNNVIIG